MRITNDYKTNETNVQVWQDHPFDALCIGRMEWKTGTWVIWLLSELRLRFQVWSVWIEQINKSKSWKSCFHVWNFENLKCFLCNDFFWNIFHQNFASSFLHIFVRFLQKSLILSFLGRWQLSRLGSVPTSVPSSGAVFFKKTEFHVFFCEI